MTDDVTCEGIDVRELARRGRLADAYERASAPERRRLRREAYELLYPVVFNHLTRRLEARRGHRDCKIAINRLRPDCLDRFHDDMDAVLDDLLRNARDPIHNLEGWVRGRMTRATIDAYRRRRGSRGALQRPRVPRWLARELRHDQRLLQLAVDMLEWVGTDATAGAEDWPIQTWASRRAVETGDYDAARRAVTHEIAVVTAAMRTRPRWYRDYVERPLGHKPIPVAAHGDDAQGTAARLHTTLDALDADDARRRSLVALAVAAIEKRLARGDDLRETVVDVIRTVFGRGTEAHTMDRVPGQVDHDDEALTARLADAETVDRIVAAVLDLLRPRTA